MRADQGFWPDLQQWREGALPAAITNPRKSHMFQTSGSKVARIDRCEP
jgi:hypothetical protein